MRARFFIFLTGFWPLLAKAAALPAANSAISISELLRLFGGLLIVVAVIVFLSWLVRRLNGVNLAGARGFKTLASMSLGAKEKLVLVQVARRFLLLGVTPGSINTLHDFGEALPEEFAADSKTSFAELLKAARGKS